MSASHETPEEDGAPAPQAPHRSGRARLFAALGVLFAVLAVVFGGAVAFTAWQVSDIERHDLTLADVGADEPQNYLLVGSDSREGTAESESATPGDAEVTGQRADVIMIARVDPGAGEIHLLSIPRDLWVPIAGTDHEQRINTAYASTDGRQRLIDTIEADFDIPVHHYVEIDFRGFAGIVDSLEGIPLVFDRPVRDKASGLYVDSPGCQVLGGEQALAFARSRHLQYLDEKGRWRPDGSGDLGRISRQQVFMRALLERGAGEQFDVGDLGDGLVLLTTVSDYVGVDDELDIDFMSTLAREFQGFGGDQLHTYSLPVTPFTTDGGAAVLELEELESQAVLNVFRGLPPDAVDPSLVEVSVWNGSGEPGQAGDAEAELEQAGFEVPDIDDAPERVDLTVVRYGPGLEEAAELVARYLDAGAVLEEDASLGEDEIVLVTGPDYEGVREEPAEDVVVPEVPGGSDAEGGGEGEGEPADGDADGDAIVEAGDDGEARPSTTTTEPVGVLPAEVAIGGC